MAPQQNTFAVIPAAPGRVGGAPRKPPMTSKQAQKLYKQANKEPRRSKAEQRKWEKERQEEIRKELEKERAAVKARAARERKKAKEEEARENRRRAGQPLFDCRPSQDTIARFVRGNGTSRKRDSSGEPIPKDEHTPANSPERKPKPLPASPAAKTTSSVSSLQTVPSEDRELPTTSMAPPPRLSPKSGIVIQPPQSVSKSPNHPPSDGMPPPLKLPSKDGPPLLPPGLPTDIKHSSTVGDKTLAVPMSMGPPPRPQSKSKSKPFMMPRVALPVHQPPRHKIFKHNAPSESSVHPPLEVLPPQKPWPQMPPPQVPSRRPPSKPVVEMPPPQNSLIKMPTSQEPSAKMLPPPRPQPQAPPPSTQAIVQDCFDDFFPTASQLAMELEEDGDPGTQTKKASKQQQDDSTLTHVAPGEFTGHPTRVENVGKQYQAANSCRKPHSGTKDTTATHPRHPESALTMRSNSHTLAGASARSRASTKVHQELQGFKHKPQKQGDQSGGVSNPLRVLSTHSIKRQSTTATRTMPPPTTPHASMFPGLQDQPTKRGILQEISSNHSPAPKRAAIAAKPQLPTHFDDFFPLICTQDLMMSSQEVLDIESPAKNMTQSSSGRSASEPSPLVEMDLAAIDWDDDLDDF
ncbi:hypothetical protein CI238_08432 [Colletotrichum incanum]|uniref:Uncharacterized protein n=1 Tax=Colletotrichum incanum TaxID=1573173 RepID=A0A167D5Q1_COLIC|nr:hypothetical protein CI238_08432 [Colletotrichum incanum]